MKGIRLLGLAFFYCAALMAQPSQNRVKFSPELPSADRAIKLSYNIDTLIFHKGNVQCKVYFTGINDGDKETFPSVFQPKLYEENGVLSGSMHIPAEATGLVVVFLDSLELNVDNNKGEGYWTPLFTGADLLPGSLSGIGDLYTKGWPPQLHLGQRKDIARKLYERDFEKHPELKRAFSQYYLTTFDTHDVVDRELFRKELSQYSKYVNLSEWELLDVKRHYASLSEPDSAKKYEKLLFERYPNGSWALQVNSLNPAIQVDLMKDHQRKWEAYKEFKKKYCSAYPDEETRFRMNNRLGQILRGMAHSFAERGDLGTWEKEVDELDEKPRYNTYKGTSALLLDHIKSSSRLDKNEPRGTTAPTVEMPRLWLVSSNDEQLILYSERLARMATTWFRHNLDAPREMHDKPYFTDEEILVFRQERLAAVLDVLGQNLLLQNRVEEANQVLREAVDVSKRKDGSINEHYVESLIKTGRIDEAIHESERMISIGKGTVAVNEFYKRMAGDTSPGEKAKHDLDFRLKKEMIDQEMPNGILLNGKGETMSMKDLKGKIIVIDFWATWCVPCIVGIQSSLDVVMKYEAHPEVVFLFVNTERISDETKRRVNKRLQEMDNAFESFYDPDYNTTKAFKVDVLPTTCIIDKRGKIRFRKSGVMMKASKQELSDELTAMIELLR